MSKKRLANWKCADLRESMQWTQGHTAEGMMQWTHNAAWIEIIEGSAIIAGRIHKGYQHGEMTPG